MSEILVESIMTSQVFTISPQMSVRDAISLILVKKVSGAPIVDSTNTVISMISEGNLLKLAAFAGLDAKIHSCLDQLIKPTEIVTVRKTQPVMDVYKLFLQHQYHRIAVTDGTGKLQGIVSRSNVLRVFLQFGGAQ